MIKSRLPDLLRINVPRLLTKVKTHAGFSMFQAVVHRPGSLSAGSEMARNPARVLASDVRLSKNLLINKNHKILTMR